MIRITTIFLCVLLAAAAFGRYKAEVSVREQHEDLDRIQVSQAEELRTIQMLRAEIAYLENPERLAKVAMAKTDLRPSRGDQLVTAREFAIAFGVDEFVPDEGDDDPSKDVIMHALAMAQVTETP